MPPDTSLFAFQFDCSPHSMPSHSLSFSQIGDSLRPFHDMSITSASEMAPNSLKLTPVGTVHSLMYLSESDHNVFAYVDWILLRQCKSNSCWGPSSVLSSIFDLLLSRFHKAVTVPYCTQLFKLWMYLHFWTRHLCNVDTAIDNPSNASQSFCLISASTNLDNLLLNLLEIENGFRLACFYVPTDKLHC
jgi:hypothetical protein